MIFRSVFSGKARRFCRAELFFGVALSAAAPPARPLCHRGTARKTRSKERRFFMNAKNSAQKFRKVCMVALLAAGMLLGVSGPASAIDFKVKGEWLVGFGVADTGLTRHTRNPGFGQPSQKSNNNDVFGAAQRVRLQLDAVASEALSGTVFFEIGDQNWGRDGGAAAGRSVGGALGADGVAVEVKNAYIDWIVPQTDLKFRMGLQGLALPNVAGGSAVLDADVAAVVASYQFNDNVGLTAFWARPINDNYRNGALASRNSTDKDNFLDNIDLFALALPLTFDGVEVTPWVMYGMIGKNAFGNLNTTDGDLSNTIFGTTAAYYNYPGANPTTAAVTSKHYGSLFWAGLPVAITAFDPLNIEFDINYGYAEAMGRYDVVKRMDPTAVDRASTQRQGWLAKALIEYKLDWGVPGIFGWYASGDDGNVKNGSERMPSIAGAGNFTSFVGDGNLAWGPGNGDYIDWNMSYAGTWGIGAQLRDMSFVEDLSHTFRIAYWGGTNSTSMVKYMRSASAWNDGIGADGPYLTTHDGLLEFNLVNAYQIYENLEMNLELGYVVNMMDNDTWRKRGYTGGGNGSFSKQDAWKAQLVFAYSF